MIVPPTGVRVWLANGHTDMRRGMNGLALQVQQALRARPARRATSTCSAGAAVTW